MYNKTAIDETSSWTPYIYLIEVNDLVIGYNDETEELGVSNYQAEGLANRTQFLKQLFEAGHSVTGEHSVSNSSFGPAAGISEDKLALDHSTNSLYGAIQNLNEDLLDTEALVTQVGESTLDLFEAVGKAIPLSWHYSNKYFDFELFLRTGNLTLMDMPEVNVIETTDGDDSIDIADTSALEVGRTYIIHNGDGTSSYPVKVAEVLTSQRFRATAPFTVSLSSGKMSCTSWLLADDGNYAVAFNGTHLITRPVVGLGDYEKGRALIRCSNTPCTIEVTAQLVGSGTWTNCELIEAVSREIGYTDYEFRCPGGDVILSFKIVTESLSTQVVIKNICIMPYANYVIADDVRQPSNVAPAANATETGETPTLQGSTYYSLYGYPQDGAQFQVSSDVNFYNLAWNHTTTGAGVTNIVGAGVLSPSVVYYWRCRYKDSQGVWSAWSTPTKFATTAVFSSIAAPINASPSSNQDGVGITGCTLVSSAFRLVGSGSDTHASSQWQITSDAAFNSMVHDSAETASQKTSYLVPSEILSTSTPYYWRVRHKGTTFGWSPYSTPTRFTTSSVATSIATPTIVAPLVGATGVAPDSTTLKSSNFIVLNGSDIHDMSQWQIYDTAAFEADPSAHLVYGTGYTSVSKTTLVVPQGTLTNSKTYYWRVRHKGATYGWSAWSAVANFTTAIASSIATPTNISPSSGATNVATANLVLSASAFVANNAPGEYHTTSEWQVSTSYSFTGDTIVHSSGAVQSLTSYTVSGITLNVDTQYYWRVRYNGSSVGSSSWSIPTQFRTALAASISAPSPVAPASGATGVSPTSITFEASAFAVQNITSTHEASQWQVASDNGFTTLVWDSNEVTGTTVITKAFTTLLDLTTYYWRVRYKGTQIGWSAWSATSAFTTAQAAVLAAPTVVSPANNATNFPKYGAVATSSAFSYTGSQSTHVASRWVVATEASGVYTSIHTATVSTGNLLVTQIPENILSYSGTYYLKVQHQASNGQWSPYSPWSKFSVLSAKKFAITHRWDEDGAAYGICSDTSGNFYVASQGAYAGNILAGLSYGSTLTAYDQNGTRVWNKFFRNIKFIKAKYSIVTNKIYALSEEGTLVCVDTAGTTQWSKAVKAGGTTITPNALCIKTNGDIIIAGKTNSAAMVCYSSEGVPKWGVSLTGYNAYNFVCVVGDTVSAGGNSYSSDAFLHIIEGTPSLQAPGTLYKLDHTDFVGITAAAMHPVTKDCYLFGRLTPQKTLYAKFSYTGRTLEFAKLILDRSGGDGPPIKFDAVMDPHTGHVYTVGRARFGDRYRGAVYKLGIDGSGAWGRYVDQIGDGGGLYDTFYGLEYNSVTQNLLCVGANSDDDKSVYEDGYEDTRARRWGLIFSIMPNATGASFSSLATQPEPIACAANTTIFPDNAQFTNAALTVSTQSSAAVTLSAPTLTDVALSTSSFDMVFNGPYFY